MAGLPSRGAIVGVRPPLFCSGPSLGSAVSVPVRPVPPGNDRIKLAEPVTLVCPTPTVWGPSSEMMELVRVAAAAADAVFR